jgi:hypothetical protein
VELGFAVPTIDGELEVGSGDGGGGEHLLTLLHGKPAGMADNGRVDGEPAGDGRCRALCCTCRPDKGCGAATGLGRDTGETGKGARGDWGSVVGGVRV